MQIQCPCGFSDREGGRSSLSQSRRRFRCRFNAVATIAAPRLRPALGDDLLARPAASTARASRKKNPARLSAPTRQARQRIKPSLCRLGIQSEQTSETPETAPALRARASAALAIRKSARALNLHLKRRRLTHVLALTRARGVRRLSLPRSFLPIRLAANAGAASSYGVVAAIAGCCARRGWVCRFNARATITTPRLRPALGDGPLARPAASTARASRKKNPARPSAPTRHPRQRIKPSLCRLGIQSEQTSETLTLE